MKKSRKSQITNGRDDHDRYYKIKTPGSYSAPTTFLRNNKDIDKKSFLSWSLNQKTITRHHDRRKNFFRRKIEVFEPR